MAETLPGLTGYVLAGGRSSRMGQDKSAMRLGGVTLLEEAVGKLRRLCAEVVVIGGPAHGGADRLVADRHPGCGPIGGLEAALADSGGEWAMFLPVDMPLLPAGLVGALGAAWQRGMPNGLRVGMAVAGGVTQPLVSIVHRKALAAIQAAIGAGRYKVRPVLEEAASSLAIRGSPGRIALSRTEIVVGDAETHPGLPLVRVGDEIVWRPSAAEWRSRHLWFSNLNTPEEFAEAEQFAFAAASMS